VWPAGILKEKVSRRKAKRARKRIQNPCLFLTLCLFLSRSSTVTSKGANFLAAFLLNPGVSDLTGSFRLYERHALEEILPKIKCTGYAFQMEIVVLAKKAGFSIVEVPITFVDRLYGESKLGPREIILYLKGLVYLFFTT
jgi:dolichol-phosphate mannosyltransferase